MDGVDAAILTTDGRAALEPGASLTLPYDEDIRAGLRAMLGRTEAPAGLVARLTDAHAAAVEAVLKEAGLAPEAIDVIGFHGHTILHAPWRRVTVQIGDGARLARTLGIDVVEAFRQRDVAEGGQGAPLVPLFHAALAAGLERPLAILNVGGVANVTWIGDGFDPAAETPAESRILAFDTGPGNGMIDDWVRVRTGRNLDEGGRLAAAGHVDDAALEALLKAGFFDLPPPKSLDRVAFDPSPVAGLSVEDGAATLTAFTAASVARAAEHLPAPPRRWIICGGGRRNATLMAALRSRLRAPVDPAEAVGWDGDAIEAQAFAWLAVRCLDGLPFTLSTTTGVDGPTSGGVLRRGRN